MATTRKPKKTTLPAVPGEPRVISTPPRAPRRRPKRSAVARKGMVIIHGAGSFPDDYCKPLVAAVEQRLGGSFDYLPVYYADITNPPATEIAPPVVPPDTLVEAKFKQDLLAEMQRAYDALPPTRRVFGVAGAETRNVAGLSLAEIIVREVGAYLFRPSVTARIQARLIAGLDQAAQQYDVIVLASHSLGTVVSFDVLKESAGRYKIASWFTTGSPLGKLRRVDMRPSDLGGITPASVTRWLNLYDTTDIIADAIGPQMPDYRLFDVFVKVGNDPISAHDYFNNGETLDMLADAMR